ncbi:MAG: isoleucine--tRNA ligase [Saprospiraceae bacterium]|nr:isoleucine--tRNA ligase [Saprospiraceae bacterium]
MAKKFKEHKTLDLAEVDKQMLAYWEANQVFKRSMEEREGAPSFVFFEGPPSANGKPGIHHVLARSIKDTFCRYQTMKGKLVRRKAGWDTHGLPIELAVEKKLGITKEDIGKKISVDEYNQECRKTVMMYQDLWNNLTTKMGYWVDLDEPYITYNNNYIESVWWLLNKLYKDNMLYKGYTIQPYSPAAGTGLSSHELNQPGCYQEVTDTTVTAQFKAKANDVLPEGAFFLAWTTTPWTLPSNTALTVGAKITYVLVRTFNQYTGEPIQVVLAKDLVKKQFTGKYKPVSEELTFEAYEHGQKKIPYQVEQEFLGADLVGIKYEQLLPYAQPYETPEQAFRVIAGNFVTTEDGTGIVHTAPTFGADDAFVAKAAGVPPMLVKNEDGDLVPLVDLQGKFRPEMGEFGGRYVKNEYYGKGDVPEKSTDVDLAIKLKIENKAFKVEKYKHNYPHCWRTDKPVLYYPLDSWFVRATAAKERMIELNKTINWKPRSTGEGRFGGWLENLQDWNLSRSRFWGIPLPIWRTEDGKQEKCIGSLADLQAEIDKANAALGLDQKMPKDLHRPYIDDVVLVSENGERMQRETDLIDVWFDSGSMPYAQWHYPFENKELIDNALNNVDGERAYPADFIAEGVDQTRGWFYTLHAIGTMCFDSVAYKAVVSNGLVLDKNGEKMSKSKGNAVDPFATISKYGADATRWYMLTNAQPWDNLKFNEEVLDETRRKLFGKLFNVYNFFAQYANVDEFDGYSLKGVPAKAAGEFIPVEDRLEIDRWIMSKLNTLVKAVDADFSNYEPTSAGRKVAEFVDSHLSNWYVRLNRHRFWKGERDANKLAAFQTLYQCLETLTKLMAPIAPFFSDFLYQSLNNATGMEKHESVHLAFFPTVAENVIDSDLEQRVDYAQRICSLVHSLRRRDSIRVRQPLQKILLPVLDAQFQKQVESVESLILSEVNVKELEYVLDASGLLSKQAKPNFKTLGRRLGKHMKAAKAAIENMSQQEILQLERTNAFKLEVDGATFDLTQEDVIISSDDIEGWTVAKDREITVALDVNISNDLYQEGLARELVNRIQTMRKDKNFEITDRITLIVEKQAVLQDTVQHFGDYICKEVLATNLEVVEALELGEKVELVDDVSVRLAIEKQ